MRLSGKNATFSLKGKLSDEKSNILFEPVQKDIGLLVRSKLAKFLRL